MNKIYTRAVLAGAVALSAITFVKFCRAQEAGPLSLLPDLKVHSVSAPSSASRGTSISVSDVTTNIGTANAGQSTSEIYISTNINDVTATWLVTNHTVSAIARGKSWPWSGSVGVPASQPLGTNYYIVVANHDHLLSELNYNNNTNYVAIFINP
jgi:subtilase family serine protease